LLNQNFGKNLTLSSILFCASTGVGEWLRCVNGSRAESGCTPQRGLGGEIEEFVDESHFACDRGFDQDVDWKPLVGRISRLSAP
jgi:hypothetical protein